MEIVNVPEDLATLLDTDAIAKDLFYKLPPSHQREYIQWIEESKNPETRKNRIKKTIGMLKDGKK